MNLPHSHHWKWAAPMAIVLLLLGAPGLSAAEEASDSASASEVKRGSVARSIFTTGIVDREPVDNLTTVPNTLHRIYFFSDLRGLEGQIVTHRWEYNGKVMAEIKFKVGGPRWRVYSSKNLLPEWTGKWTVVVLDESGWPLKASVFEYTDAATEATQ
jgi:hypothetical protein